MNVQRANNFRKNLRAAMQARGLSFRALALKTGLSLSHLHGIATGKTEPGIDLCDRLADALDTPLEAMISNGQSRDRVPA